MTAQSMDALARVLWPTPGAYDGRVHAILDGARDRSIERMIRSSRTDHDCLYSGELAPRLRAAAPYIVRMFDGDPFTTEVLTRGWGESWGILAVTEEEIALKAIRRHFRQFLKVKDESGSTLLFRFYDPRVLRIWLPTCTSAEAATFFGPVARFVAEGESPDEFLVFERSGASVRVRIHAVAVARG